MGSHSQNYNTYKVYKYTSPSKKIYIGQTYRTLDQRAGKNGINYKQCPKFYNAILKYGFENFKREILKDNLNLKQANYYQQYYIKVFKSNQPDYGYNLTSGGDNPIINDQTRQKHRLAKLGTHLSEETKEKISKSNTGKIFTEQHKKHLSEAKVGQESGIKNKKHTQQTKRKIGEKNGIPVLCVETGIIYESAAEAGRLLNFGNSNHIPDSIRNPQRYKTVHGYHWKKVTKEEYKKYIEEKQE